MSSAMLVFEKVRWKNLLSTGNVFTEINLREHRSTLFVGRNGHGKSTMLDAICLALFGKPFRKVPLPKMVNSINDRDCLVELEFSIASRKYKIVRGIKPSIFVIYADGIPIDQDAASRDYQRYLEKNILKFNFKSFTQIVILGSKSFIPFMKLGPQDRRAIIEDLLDIQTFSNMNRIEKEVLRILLNDITANKKNIENAQSQIELQKRYVEDAKKNNKEQVEIKEKEVAENKAKIDEYQSTIDELEDQIEKDKLYVDAIPSLEKKIRKYRDQIIKIQNNRANIQKRKDFYKDNDACPTCKQDLQPSFKEVQYIEAGNTIKECDDAIDALQTKVDEYLSDLSGLKIVENRTSYNRNTISSVKISISHIQGYIKKLEKEIEELSSKKTLSDDMMKVSMDLVKKLQEYNDERKDLIEKKAYSEASLILLKDNGIKAKIIKQYLPIINKLVNKYLASMEFFVNFELDEEFEESFKSRYRDDFKYDNFSEGQKQMIDIALLFAWRDVARLKNSLNTNLLILDEIFDSSMDTVGADMLLTILGALPLNSNVYIISHRELLHDKFNNTIRFELQNNFSYITA